MAAEAKAAQAKAEARATQLQQLAATLEERKARKASEEQKGTEQVPATPLNEYHANLQAALEQARRDAASASDILVVHSMCERKLYAKALQTQNALC